MALTSFIWKNGTASNPVPLTTTMIDNLISKGNQLGENMQVSGYYIGSGGLSVVKSRVWSLQQLFPNLTYVGTQADDRFSISTVSSDITEGGQSIRVISSGINGNYLKYKILFDEIIIDENDTSLITEEEVKERFSVEIVGATAYLTVAPPQENATWSVRLRIKACPVYEDMDTTSNYRTTDVDIDGNPRAQGVGIIHCTAVKMTGVAISANAEMGTNTYNTIIKTPIPSNSTKLSQVTYSFNISPQNMAEYVPAYEAIHSGNTAGDISVTCWPHLFNDNLPVSNTLSINIWASRATTIRINQNISDPTAMVLNPNDSGYRNRLNSTNVIAYIRQNSHLYVGKYYGEVEGMKIKQLWDNDRRYYYDPTDVEGKGALAPIDGTPDSDGIIADVFLRLPEFYYKTVNETNSNDEETGVVAISFATGALDEGYIRWDPNTLIGVYKGTIRYNDTYVGDVVAYNTANGTSLGSTAYPVTLHSVSGKTPTINFSQANFKAAARRRNDLTAVVTSNHFSIINYQAHSVMALLYYCYWGSESINCQALIGRGTSNSPKTTGMTDPLGMTETSAVGSGNTGSINYWGLENWWGDIAEWMDDLITADNGVINILKYNGTIDRQVSCPNTGSKGCISKFVFGQYADLFPAAYSGNNYTLNFCDYGYVSGYAYAVANRSYKDTNYEGGVGHLRILGDSSYVDDLGSRLLYNGAVIEVDSL